MEPARSTDRFSRKITAADSNNIVTVLDLNVINSEYQLFEQDYKVTFQTALEDVKCAVGLFSLAPAPFPETNVLMSEATKNAEVAKVQTEGQKIALGLYTAKGNGPWNYESRIVLQNQGGDENHVPLLVPHLGTNETLLVGGNFKFGVKVEPIWNQPLKAQDYIVVSGTYKQVVSFSSKKKDDIEQLNARIEALELALTGRLTDVPANTLLGRNTTVGTVQTIPQSNFVTPAQSQAAIDQAIIDWVGSSPTNLNTLLEISAALANDPNFATTITDLIATKAPLNTSLQLTNRSNTVAAPFDANNWTNTFFAAVKWLDGGYTNLNVPINTGMIIQFDSLFLTGVKDKYRVQIYFSSSRYFVRIEVAATWGLWREISTVAVS